MTQDERDALFGLGDAFGVGAAAAGQRVAQLETGRQVGRELDRAGGDIAGGAGRPVISGGDFIVRCRPCAMHAVAKAQQAGFGVEREDRRAGLPFGRRRCEFVGQRPGLAVDQDEDRRGKHLTVAQLTPLVDLAVAGRQQFARHAMALTDRNAVHTGPAQADAGVGQTVDAQPGEQAGIDFVVIEQWRPVADTGFEWLVVAPGEQRFGERQGDLQDAGTFGKTVRRERRQAGVLRTAGVSLRQTDAE
jgi:hypothetical protein